MVPPGTDEPVMVTAALATPTSATPRARVSRWLTPALATVSGATLGLPWYRTGTTHRNAFDVVAALRGAGLLSRWPAHLFVIAITVIPGLAAVAWVLAIARYPRLSAAASAAVGALAAASGLGVLLVAHRRADLGTTVGSVVGVAVLLSSLPYAVARSPRRHLAKGQP
jgi:hypothetical protein